MQAKNLETGLGTGKSISSLKKKRLSDAGGSAVDLQFSKKVQHHLSQGSGFWLARLRSSVLFGVLHDGQ